MKSSATKRYTVDNNVNGTHNLLAAIVESGLDIHVVHLGTMGVYGYGSHRGATIPEGYLKVEVPQPDGSRFEEEILHPASPGSVYHMTKTLDQLLFLYYNKNDKVRITDLHQGIVWGTNTEATDRDPRLTNRFDYDGDYGTVLNRFLMQAAIGYPLTVHGTGGQTRAFIHIRDSVKCVQIALDNPPEQGERVKIFNQMTESHQVGELANKVAALTGAKVNNLPNPRNEAVENDLIVDNRCFIELGLNPTTLDDGLLKEVVEIATDTPTAAIATGSFAPPLGPKTKPRPSATPPKSGLSFENRLFHRNLPPQGRWHRHPAHQNGETPGGCR
jgi:UDP-sulfoquinovose synthase